MPEKTKPKKETEREKKREVTKDEVETEEIDRAAWSQDQQQKSYYYDDAHGYEIYNPDEDDDED